MISKTTSLLVTAIGITFAGCTQQPKTYSCYFKNHPQSLSSLSISSNTAILGNAEYGAFCGKEGNELIYGLTEQDCKTLHEQTEQSKKTYSILVFDEIIGEASQWFFLGKTMSSEFYSCQKANL